MDLLFRLRDGINRVAPTLGAVLPWAGGLLMLMALGFAEHSWKFVHERVRATATVTENVSAFAKEGGVLYYPRFRFISANGELVQVLATAGSDEIEFSAGDTVPVLYRAGDPQGAVISTTMRVYATAIWLGVFGIAVFDLGWVLRGIVLKRGLA